MVPANAPLAAARLAIVVCARPAASAHEGASGREDDQSDAHGGYGEKREEDDAHGDVDMDVRRVLADRAQRAGEAQLRVRDDDAAEAVDVPQQRDREQHVDARERGAAEKETGEAPRAA